MAKRQPQAEPSSGLPRLPPGRHGLPREFVAQNQRDRLAAGIIAAVSEFGYRDATITQISTAAGVSRRTFYAYFNSKEECYFATFDQIVAHICDAAAAAAAQQDGWPKEAGARIGAALDVFAANPQLARFTLAVPPRAGGEVTAHYRRALDSAIDALLDGIPADLGERMPSKIVRDSLAGGAASLVVQRLDAGEGAAISALRPDLVELVLTPFVGAEDAVAVVAALE